MASHSIHPATHSFAHNVMRAFVAPFAAFGQFLVNINSADARIRLLERMNNLTDVELAEQYGINRDQIVAYVFGDKMSYL